MQTSIYNYHESLKVSYGNYFYGNVIFHRRLMFTHLSDVITVAGGIPEFCLNSTINCLYMNKNSSILGLTCKLKSNV